MNIDQATQNRYPGINSDNVLKLLAYFVNSPQCLVPSNQQKKKRKKNTYKHKYIGKSLFFSHHVAHAHKMCVSSGKPSISHKKNNILCRLICPHFLNAFAHNMSITLCTDDGDIVEMPKQHENTVNLSFAAA